MKMDISSLLDTLNPQVGIVCVIIVSFCLHMLIKRNKNKKTNKTDDSSETEDEGIFEDGDEYKLALVVRNDLKMGKGKAAAQCAHAAVAAYKKCLKYPNILKAWEREGQRKITLKVDNEAELLELVMNAKSLGLLTNVVSDAGHTQVAPGSKTVCAIGPGPSQMVNTITGHLKLY